MFFQNRQGLSRKRFEIRVGEVLFELRPYRPYPIPWFFDYRQDAGNERLVVGFWCIFRRILRNVSRTLDERFGGFFFDFYAAVCLWNFYLDWL